MLNTALPAGTAPATCDANESRTRDRVLRAVSEHGPVTAAALGDLLGLTCTAVRRHLDLLLDAGHIELHEATRSGHRGRGRPARAWVLSPSGHSALRSDYDHLAGAAIRFLAETAGPDAVGHFAGKRATELEDRYAEAVDAAGDSPADRAQALVTALTADGFSASARTVGAPGAGALTGIQVCQGHCPVQGIAAEFPQFCDAETEAFSRLLGVHVQRLATLAHGDFVCTTFIPTPAVPPKKRSTS